MNKIKVGLPPESVVYTGDRKSEKYDLSVLSFSKETLIESKELPNKNEGDLSQWVSLQGLNSIDIIKKVGANYSINPLVQEDIVNTYHKPKIEVSDDYVFIILEYVLGSHPELKKSNISFYLGKNYLISFWDDEKVLFEKVKTRFKAKDSLVRTRSVDFLLSRLIDRVVDEYYVSLEHFNDLLEAMEDEVISDASSFDHKRIHTIKKEVRKLRRSAIGGKGVLYTLISDSNGLIEEDNLKYLRDTYEHASQIVESCDIQIEQLNSIKNTYDSELNTSLNQTMKVLTLISSIFIPTTFIAGVLGMNFEFIPGMKNENGFYFTLGIMGVITVLLLIYFKKRKWF